MRAAGSVFIALCQKVRNERRVALAWCPRIHRKRSSVGPDVASVTIVSAPNGGVTRSEQRQPLSLRVRAMPGRAWRAGVEHLDGRVGGDIEDDQALIGDPVDLNLRHVAGGQELPLGRELDAKDTDFPRSPAIA